MENITPPAARADSVAVQESAAFELAQRQARVLASSDLVPKEFQGNIGNCLIAMELAKRLDMPVFMVIQNIHVIRGKPTWSAPFIGALVNTSGRFGPLRYVINKHGKSTIMRGKEPYEFEEIVCHVEASTADGFVAEGPPVSISMAIRDGWMFRDGSKWQTLPGLMLRYRALCWFARLHCPERLCGLHTDDEVAGFSRPATKRPTLRTDAEETIDLEELPASTNQEDAPEAEAAEAAGAHAADHH